MSDHTNSGCACTPNRAIKCEVTSCANHCQSQSYCGLNAIQVGHGSVHRLPELPQEVSKEAAQPLLT